MKFEQEYTFFIHENTCKFRLQNSGHLISVCALLIIMYALDKCDIFRSVRLYASSLQLHDDVIERKHFPRYWPGEFPAQRPVTRNFDVFFDLRLNKRLSKQWSGWWFETLSCPLWHHYNVYVRICSMQIPFKLSRRFGMPGQKNPASAMHFEALTGVPTKTSLF